MNLYSRLIVFSIIFILLFVTQKNLSAENTQTQDTAEQMITKIKTSFINGKLDSVFINTKILMDYSRKNSLIFYEGRSNEAMGSYHLFTGNNDSALYYYKIADLKFYECEELSFQGQINSRIASIYNNTGNNDTAIYYYNRSLDMIILESDPLWYGINKNHLGLLYMELGDYYQALKNMQDAIIAYKLNGDIIRMGNEYNNMGIIYKEINDINKAEEAYLNSINILSEISETTELAMAYTNLSSIYINGGQTELGLELLEKGKVIFEETGFLKGLSGYYSVLSSYYNTEKPSNYNKVIESSKKGLSIAKEYNDHRQYAHATTVLGTAYLKTNQIDNAETILILGLRVSEKYELNDITSSITKLLSEVYEKKAQTKKALEFLNRYVVLSESLINEEKIIEFTSLDLNFKFHQLQIKDSLETVLREQEINLLHEQELNNQKRSKLIFAFSSLIIIIMASFVFYNSAKNKKQTRLLNIKNNEIEKSLNEKELLLKEVHHRVKNNFQTVSSLMELQMGEIKDKKALEIIIEGQNRINAMALIHKRLYLSDDISKVNFYDYTGQLVKEISSLYQACKIETTLRVIDVHLDIDTAIPLGLIINELITNAFKHAFSEDRNNALIITLTNKNTNYILKIADNGEGLSENFNIMETKSLGLRLINLLSKQLHGSFNYQYDGGGIFEITFKDKAQRKEIE